MVHDEIDKGLAAAVQRFDSKGQYKTQQFGQQDEQERHQQQQDQMPKIHLILNDEIDSQPVFQGSNFSLNKRKNQPQETIVDNNNNQQNTIHQEILQEYDMKLNQLLQSQHSEVIKSQKGQEQLQQQKQQQQQKEIIKQQKTQLNFLQSQHSEIFSLQQEQVMKNLKLQLSKEEILVEENKEQQKSSNNKNNNIKQLQLLQSYYSNEGDDEDQGQPQQIQKQQQQNQQYDQQSRFNQLRSCHSSTELAAQENNEELQHQDNLQQQEVEEQKEECQQDQNNLQNQRKKARSDGEFSEHHFLPSIKPFQSSTKLQSMSQSPHREAHINILQYKCVVGNQLVASEPYIEGSNESEGEFNSLRLTENMIHSEKKIKQNYQSNPKKQQDQSRATIKQQKNSEMLGRINEEESQSPNTPSSKINNNNNNNYDKKIINIQDQDIPKKDQSSSICDTDNFFADLGFGNMNKEQFFNQLKVTNSQYNIPVEQSRNFAHSKQSNNVSFGNDLQQQQQQQDKGASSKESNNSDEIFKGGNKNNNYLKVLGQEGMLQSSNESQPMQPRQAVSHLTMEGWESQQVSQDVLYEILEKKKDKETQNNYQKAATFLAPLCIKRFESDEGTVSQDEIIENIPRNSSGDSLKELSALLEKSCKNVRTVAVGENNMVNKLTALREELIERNQKIEKLVNENEQLNEIIKKKDMVLEALQRSHKVEIDVFNRNHDKLVEYLQGKAETAIQALQFLQCRKQNEQEKETNMQMAKDNLNLYTRYEEISGIAEHFRRVNEEQREILEEKDQGRGMKGDIADDSQDIQESLKEKEIEDYKNIAEGYKRDIEVWKNKHKGLKKEIAKLKQAFDEFRISLLNEVQNQLLGNKNSETSQLQQLIQNLQLKYQQESDSARSSLSIQSDRGNIYQTN